jgi:hypothetical protein
MVQFNNNECILMNDDGRIVAKGIREDNLHEFVHKSAKCSNESCV